MADWKTVRLSDYEFVKYSKKAYEAGMTIERWFSEVVCG